jgi:hypothetical protein
MLANRMRWDQVCWLPRGALLKRECEDCQRHGGPAEDQGGRGETADEQGLKSVASSNRASKQMGAHGHSTTGCRDVKLVRGLAALEWCAGAAVVREHRAPLRWCSVLTSMFMSSNRAGQGAAMIRVSVPIRFRPRRSVAGQCNPLRAYRNGPWRAKLRQEHTASALQLLSRPQRPLRPCDA